MEMFIPDKRKKPITVSGILFNLTNKRVMGG